MISDIKVVDLRNLYSTSGVGESKVTVDAVTYGSAANQWMDTAYHVAADSPFAGKTIVITGTLEHYDRDPLSRLLESLGAEEKRIYYDKFTTTGNPQE